MFYICALGVIMAVVPWSTIDGNSSPFVQIFDSVGVHAAAGILNFVCLTAVMSVYNSGLYATRACCIRWRSRAMRPRIWAA